MTLSMTRTTGSDMKPESERLELRPLTDNDIGAVHALSVEVAWPHRPEDWRLFHEVGHGVVACDGAERVVGSAMWWPFGDKLGCIGMVIVSPRLQAKGTGRRMMRTLFEAAGDRTLKLNATPAGLRLYQSEGFEPIGEIFQHQGIAKVTREKPPVSVRPLRDEDWEAIIELDREAYGGDRKVLMEALASRAKGTVYEIDGAVAGFALCRPFGRGHVVGPIVAMDDDAAIALTLPHVEDHAGSFLRVDTPSADGEFPRFLEEAGLVTVDRVLSMARGPFEKPPGPARIFGLVSQALG
jgi:predicted N-acetyltransferase YhbS